MTVLWSAVEVQSRSSGRYPEDQASVAVVVLNPRSAAACSGRVFPGAFWSQSAQMFRNNCRLWDKVFYCFVSLQVPRLPSCLLYYSFQAVKAICLLYFWLASETFYSAPACVQKSRGGRAAHLSFLWSPTEEFNHQSAHTEGCSQLLEDDTCKTVFLLCAKWRSPKHDAEWQNHKPKIAWTWVRISLWLCSTAVWGHASQSLTVARRANVGLSHCRE